MTRIARDDHRRDGVLPMSADAGRRHRPNRMECADEQAGHLSSPDGSRSPLREVGGSRGPLIAAAVGAVGFVLAVVLLISVIALIGSGDGLTAGTLVVPVGRIVVVVGLGYLLALALLVLALRSRSAQISVRV